MSLSDTKVLLIDDDPMIHDAVRLVLEPEGCQVECCLTGESGLEALRTARPDVVLLDIMLSTPSEGFHIAYELRRCEEWADIPIIVISAIGKTTGINFARDLGTDYLPAECFLEKPFSADALRNAVREALARGAGK